MKRPPLVTVCLFLYSNCARALRPGAKIIGSDRGMSGLRRRLKQRTVRENSQDQTVIGSSLFWRRKGRRGETNGRSAEIERAGGGSEVPVSEVIHLGKLRIPPSRRLHLTATRAPPDLIEESMAAATSSSRLPCTETTVDGASLPTLETERGDDRGDVEVDGKSLSEASLVIGDPSVIPCGVSEDSLDKGVVQIPLQFTVGKTVEFIRSVSSSDRYSSKVLHAMTEKTTGAEREGGIGVAEAPWPSSAFSSPSLLDRGNYKMRATLSSRIYVTEAGRMRGYITMADLLTHQPETPVVDLLREMKELLREGDSWQDAARRLRYSNVMAAPVVDSDGVLVAVLNPSDLMKEMEIEATDDIMRQSGSGGGESYFGTPLSRLVASRVGWLVSLLCLQSLSSLILQSYQHVIEKNIVIALFLTMLTGTAGNAGNQSSAIVIRGLATGEINNRNRWRVIWREARAAVASAFILSVASYGRVLMTPGATTVATLAVAVAMGATVIGAVMFGTVAPIVLDGMGVDPVNFASPALATLTDVSGVFILCSIAKFMLMHLA